MPKATSHTSHMKKIISGEQAAIDVEPQADSKKWRLVRTQASKSAQGWTRTIKVGTKKQIEAMIAAQVALAHRVASKVVVSVFGMDGRRVETKTYTAAKSKPASKPPARAAKKPGRTATKWDKLRATLTEDPTDAQFKVYERLMSKTRNGAASSHGHTLVVQTLTGAQRAALRGVAQKISNETKRQRLIEALNTVQRYGVPVAKKPKLVARKPPRKGTSAKKPARAPSANARTVPVSRSRARTVPDRTHIERSAVRPGALLTVAEIKRFADAWLGGASRFRIARRADGAITISGAPREWRRRDSAHVRRARRAPWQLRCRVRRGRRPRQADRASPRRAGERRAHGGAARSARHPSCAGCDGRVARDLPEQAHGLLDR